MLSLESLLDRITRLDPVDGFPGVDELRADLLALAGDYPDAVTHAILGSSRLGDPIDEFTIGSGARHVVIVGGVHPNEPIGFRTVQHLARLALEPDLASSLDVTWHLVPCIDPDGTRLNESWFPDPADRQRYFRGFYRPAPLEQVEWSFPFHYKSASFDDPIPETRALMALLDRVRPDLFVGLHNAEFGGVYFYLNRDDRVLAEQLQAIPPLFGLPLDVGEPESPELVAIAAGVFRAPLARERYDYLEMLGLDPAKEASGAGTADYLEQYGTATLVAELPYWTHPDAADASPSDRLYRDVLAEKADDLAELHEYLDGVLTRAGDGLTIDSPFLRASRAFVPAMGSAAAAERARLDDPAVDRPASVAEVFGNREVVRMFRLRFGGTLRRALSAEVEAGTSTRLVRALHSELSEWFDGWNAAEEAGHLTPAPVASLVGVQLAAIFAAVLADAVRTDTRVA